MVKTAYSFSFSPLQKMQLSQRLFCCVNSAQIRLLTLLFMMCVYVEAFCLIICTRVCVCVHG